MGCHIACNNVEANYERHSLTNLWLGRCCAFWLAYVFFVLSKTITTRRKTKEYMAKTSFDSLVVKAPVVVKKKGSESEIWFDELNRETRDVVAQALMDRSKSGSWIFERLKNPQTSESRAYPLRFSAFKEFRKRFQEKHKTLQSFRKAEKKGA